MACDSSPPIRWVLFDAVGTLFWPDPPVASAYQRIGEQFGCCLTEQTVIERFREAYRREFETRTDFITEVGERERWRKVVESVFPAAADSRRLFEQLWQHFANPRHWRLATGGLECLEALTARGFTPGIASNFDGRLRKICRTHRLLIEDRHLFISSELGSAKPQPEFYQTVTRRLQCRPGEILLVGNDRAHDYEGAIAAGWQARLLGQNENLREVVSELH